MVHGFECNQCGKQHNCTTKLGEHMKMEHWKIEDNEDKEKDGNKEGSINKDSDVENQERRVQSNGENDEDESMRLKKAMKRLAEYGEYGEGKKIKREIRWGL